MYSDSDLFAFLLIVLQQKNQVLFISLIGPKHFHFLAYVYTYSGYTKLNINAIKTAYLFTIFPPKLLQEFGVKTPFHPNFGPKTPKKLFLKSDAKNPQKPSNARL